MYRNKTDFYILILYLATCFDRIFVTSLSVIITCANGDNFASILLIEILIISFSCLIALVVTPRNIPKKTDKGGYSCPVCEEKLPACHCSAPWFLGPAYIDFLFFL